MVVTQKFCQRSNYFNFANFAQNAGVSDGNIDRIHSCQIGANPWGLWNVQRRLMVSKDIPGETETGSKIAETGDQCATADPRRTDRRGVASMDDRKLRRVNTFQ